ncbi:hypothetical protein SODALDRAFT_184020 [Sodiomyces alkalinus F11]|uniref:Uncharacterized protein n=1 Tax=Sodiomyces alkalinus (strain CBS 110278 / VKM F-3762 / F11) TaxID=1314773 RepID=A0A3N2PUP0_SODAK|nr:hypothetical protein SODALDRAFT_184020 [Sodiomyces alkalinus F11]ROT38209.1 hypothetical protein SODALDRAFT_184020 [Sodiomyces alkalinus F11]
MTGKGVVASKTSCPLPPGPPHFSTPWAHSPDVAAGRHLGGPPGSTSAERSRPRCRSASHDGVVEQNPGITNCPEPVECELPERGS